MAVDNHFNRTVKMVKNKKRTEDGFMRRIEWPKHRDAVHFRPNSELLTGHHLQFSLGEGIISPFGFSFGCVGGST
jgi:hypothetical protein